MAKKDAGKKKKDPAAGKKQQSRGDAVRAAAAQAIEATAGQAGFTRERAQQIADELVSAAGRFRETLEDLRPAGPTSSPPCASASTRSRRASRRSRRPAPPRAGAPRRPSASPAEAAAGQPAAGVLS